MKLVVCYTVGDGYTYSCDCTTPIEYDSAEQLLEDIEHWVNRYQTDMKAFEDSREGFYKQHGTMPALRGDHKAKDAWFKLWQDWMKDNIYPNPAHYKVGDLIPDSFIEEGKFVAPEIYELEEWFDKFKGS